MTEEELLALSQVQLNTAVSPDDVWSPLQHHVPGLHENVANAVLGRFAQAERGVSPIGVALVGEPGVGKTHMLRRLRQDVQDRGGCFFLVKFMEGNKFWHSALHSVVSGFYAGDGNQLTGVLQRLCAVTGVDDLQRSRICGTIPVSRTDLDAFVEGLLDVDRQVGTICEDTARALVLYRARGVAGEAGRSYFALDGGLDEELRGPWGVRRGARPPQEILSDLSRLLALVGPTVIAVDQFDSLMVQSRPVEGGPGEVPIGLVNQVADGLMELREQTRRTLTVVACVPKTWELIRTRAISTAADRFTVAQMKGTMPGSEVAAQLVGVHLATRYGEIGFTPPYSTWPVRPEAFATAGHRTPRRLLSRVGEHIRQCLESDQLLELVSFDEPPPDTLRPRPVDDAALGTLDETFRELRATADVTAPMSPVAEDDVMPRILAAGLNAYILELGERGQDYALDPPPGAKPSLHARLRMMVDERTDDQVHWSFRGIASTHPNAVLSRLRNARIEAGHQAGVTKRKLVLLRNTQLSAGKVTTARIAEFEQAGGQSLPITETDIRTFSALELMLGKHDPALLPWLASRRPAGYTTLFRKVFGEGPSSVQPAPAPPRAAEIEIPPTTEQPEPTPAPAREPVVPTGRTVAADREIGVPLRILRQHAVVFAGSGSGKTVLLRRLIEECALHGVSSIVLDPEQRSCAAGRCLAAAAAVAGATGTPSGPRRYLNGTEVVVWTPRRQQGRPLVLRPLPDFGDVRADRRRARPCGRGGRCWTDSAGQAHREQDGHRYRGVATGLGALCAGRRRRPAQLRRAAVGPAGRDLRDPGSPEAGRRDGRQAPGRDDRRPVVRR